MRKYNAKKVQMNFRNEMAMNMYSNSDYDVYKNNREDTSDNYEVRFREDIHMIGSLEDVEQFFYELAVIDMVMTAIDDNEGKISLSDIDNMTRFVNVLEDMCYSWNMENGANYITVEEEV